jgi:hypothetical protein
MRWIALANLSWVAVSLLTGCHQIEVAESNFATTLDALKTFRELLLAALEKLP